jgi:hypothetical protein
MWMVPSEGHNSYLNDMKKGNAEMTALAGRGMNDNCCSSVIDLLALVLKHRDRLDRATIYQLLSSIICIIIRFSNITDHLGPTRLSFPAIQIIIQNMALDSTWTSMMASLYQHQIEHIETKLLHPIANIRGNRRFSFPVQT